jgi:hypothetical protein
MCGDGAQLAALQHLRSLAVVLCANPREMTMKDESSTWNVMQSIL